MGECGINLVSNFKNLQKGINRSYSDEKLIKLIEPLKRNLKAAIDAGEDISEFQVQIKNLKDWAKNQSVTIQELFNDSSWNFQSPKVDQTQQSTPEPQIDQTKTRGTIIGDVNDINTDITKNFLNRIFYGSDAENLLLRQFRINATRRLIVDILNGTQTSPDRLNESIASYQEELFNTIKDYVGADKFASNVQLLFGARRIGSNLFDIKEQLIQLDKDFDIENPNYNPGSIDSLYQKYVQAAGAHTTEGNKDVQKLNALNALITLTYFDDLLKMELGRWIRPKQQYYNTPQPARVKKYELKEIEAQNQNISWRDDEKGNNGWDILNDVHRRIIETMPFYQYDAKTQSWIKTERYLGQDFVNVYVASIKGKLRKVKTTNNTISIDENNNISIFGNTRIKLSGSTKEALLFIKGYRGLSKMDLSIGELVAYARLDPAIMFKALSEIIYTGIINGKQKEFGLTQQESDIIVSFHKNMFEQIDENGVKGKSLLNASKQYYRELCSLFDVSTAVDNSQYTKRKGVPDIRIMTPVNSRWLANKIQTQVNAHLSANRLPGLNERYQPTLNLIDPKRPSISIYLKGSNTQYKIDYEFKNNKMQIYQRSTQRGTRESLWKITPTVDKHTAYKFVKDVLGKDLETDVTFESALMSQFQGTSSSRAVVDYLLSIAIPSYANAVAFRSVDIVNQEYIGQGQFNKITDPYSIKIGEVIYEKNETGTGVNEIIVIPDGAYKSKDSQGRTYYLLNNKYLDSKDTEVPQTTTIEIRDRGYRGTRKNSKLDTRIEIRDQKVMSISAFRKKIANNEGEFYYKALNPYSLSDQWYGIGSKDPLKNKTYEGLDVFTLKTYPRLGAYIQAEALVNGLTTKSTLRTGEGTDLSVGGTNMLFSERQSFWAIQGIDEQGFYKNPLKGLMDMAVDENGDPIISSYHLSREFVDGPNQKQHKDFNLKESATAAFIYDYLAPLYVDNKNVPEHQRTNELIRFVEAVVSDKPRVPLIGVLRSKVLELDSRDTVKQKVFDVFGTAYGRVFNNILQDCNTLTQFIRNYKGPDALPDAHQLTISILDDYKGLNTWAENHSEWCKQHKITPLKLIRYWGEKYNLSHRLDPLHFVEETHFRKADGMPSYKVKDHIESVLSFLQQVERYTKPLQTDEFKEIFNTDIKQIAREHFLRRATNDLKPKERTPEKALDLAKTYFDEWKAQSNYDNFQRTNLLNMLQSLLKNNFTVNFKDENGDTLQWVKNAGWHTVESITKKYGNQDFFNSNRMALAVIRDSEGNLIKQITKRTDLYGYTDGAGKRHEFQDAKGRTILDASFDLNSGLKDVVDGKSTNAQVEVNPDLELFNLRHFYFTQLSVLMTNGSHVWSDAKKDTNKPKEEGAKYFDFNKRNVVNTAANSQFRIGDSRGIPMVANTAITEDIRSLCIGINGDEAYVKPYDGMTRICPWMVHWENYSLNQSVTATTKKPIGYAFLEKYLAGYVHKTASFGITNQSMRESFWDRRIMWKMTKHAWMVRNSSYDSGYAYGDSFDLDITKSDTGNINYGGRNPEEFLYYKTNTKTGLKYYRIDGIEKLKRDKTVEKDPNYKPNTYTIKITRVDKDGNVQYKSGGPEQFEITRTINSNYALWDVLGGYNSLEFRDGTLYDSENSIKKVAEVAGQVKLIGLNYTDSLGQTRTIYRQLTNQFKTFFKNASSLEDGFKFNHQVFGELNLSDREIERIGNIIISDELSNSTTFVTTPMKESDIHILATKGSVKKGFANVNGTEKYTNNEDLNFMRVKLIDYGIQLDAEHEADKSVVSMMTQVISALADRGRTHDLAQQVYDALSRLTANEVAEYMDNFESYLQTGDRKKLQHTITNLIVREFMTSSSRASDTDIARAITARLVQEGLSGKSLSEAQTLDLLPTSDGSVFPLLLSTVSSVINKTAIKAQMFGTLSVLCPAHGIQKIIGGKKLTDIKTFDELKSLQINLQNNAMKHVGDIELKRVYQVNYSDGTKDANGEDIIYSDTYRIKDMADYYELRDFLAKQKEYSIYEKVYDLGEIVSNTDTAKFGWYLLTLKPSEEGEQPKQIGINVDDNFRNALSKYQINPDEVQSVNKIDIYSRDLAPYNVHFTDQAGKKYTLYDLQAVREKYELQVLKDAVSSIIKKVGDGPITREQLDAYINGFSVSNYSPTNEDSNTPAKKEFIHKVLNKFWDLENNNQAAVLLRAKSDTTGADLLEYINNEFKKYADTLQEQLYIISNKSKIKSFLDQSDNQIEVNVIDENGNVQTVNVLNYSVNPYECLLPRIYAEQFGLRWGDSVASINSPEFFYKRLIENYRNSNMNELNYDVSLKLLNGRHIYLKLNSIGQNPGDVLSKQVIQHVVQGDKIYRKSQYGTKLEHEMSSVNDEVWIDDETNTEVTVVKTSTTNSDLTQNLKFYLDKIKYQQIELSDELLKSQTNLQVVLDAIKESNNATAKDFTTDFIQEVNDDIITTKDISAYYDIKHKFNTNVDMYLNPKNYEEVFKNNKDYQGLLQYQIRGKIKNDAYEWLKKQDEEDKTGKKIVNKITSSLWKSAQEQYSSFRKSLEFTVARIPAQSMQSFMAMKVVGFVEENVNNCYVCDDQIWLQGSDFDIDKATFMGYAFNNHGKFIGWSPYFQLRTYELLKASESLPFPTNKVITDLPGDNTFNYDILLYDEKNNPDGILIRKKNKYVLKNGLTTRQVITLARLIRTANEVRVLQTDEEHKPIVNAIKYIVNRHNRFDGSTSNRKGSDITEFMLKNFIASNAFNISKDPANIPASQTSVDVAADPFRDLANGSSFGGSTSGSRPGDVTIYFSALEFNQTGKDVIGITASNGVKVYYALSQLVNEKLSKEDLHGLTFDVRFNGQHYTFLADAFVELSKTLDQHIKDTIKANPQKADLMISGLLSLATDNAKELKLGKLNAGRELAGLYIYGITIGIPIEQIYKKLTSPLAIAIDRLMKGNILNDEYGLTLTQAINYIADGQNIIGNILLKDTKSKYGKEVQEKHHISASEWNRFASSYGIPQMSDDTTMADALKDPNKSLLKTILDAAQDSHTFNQYLNRFEDYKALVEQGLKNYEANSEDSNKKYTIDLIRQNLEDIQDYIYTVKEITQKDGKTLTAKEVIGDLLDIEVLNDGFQEIGKIRAQLGLNQGIKTKLEDKLKFYDDFSKIVEDRKKTLQQRKRHLNSLGDKSEVNKIDLMLDKIKEFEKLNKTISDLPKVVLEDDPTRISFSLYFNSKKTFEGKTYKEIVDTLYNEIKQSFNVFNVVDALPHYKAYREAAYIDYISASTSAKFRALSNVLLPIINNTYKPNKRSLRNYLRRAQWFLESTLINQFLLEEPVLELVYKTKTIGDSTLVDRIQLGTTEGNATFKSWMENVLIPYLKDDPNLKDNDFIKDLTADFNNQTLTKNKTVAYTLPIDMIPRSDVERAALSKYRVAFNKLNKAVYFENGEGKYVEHDLMKLFFYYNLINYRNSNNTNSLTPLIQKMVELGANPTLEKYTKFVASFDRINDFKIAENSGETGAHFTVDDIYRALAPDETEISIQEAKRKRIPYIRFYNNVTMRYDLFKHQLPEELQKEEETKKQVQQTIDTLIEQDSKNPDKMALMQDLQKQYNGLSAIEKKQAKGIIILARMKALRNKSYGEEEDNFIEGEDIVADQDAPFTDDIEPETFEGEQPYYDEGESINEGLEEGLNEDIDQSAVQQKRLNDRKGFFRSNHYVPTEMMEEDLIRNTPYVSTLGPTIKLTGQSVNFSVGRLEATLLYKNEEGKDIVKVSNIKVKTSEGDKTVEDIILKDVDSISSVDANFERILNTNEAAILINREIDKQLNIGC